MVISHPFGRLDIAQAIQRVPRAQEGFLDQIFGQHLIVAQPAADAAEVSGIGPNHRLETPLPGLGLGGLDRAGCIGSVIHD